MDMVDMWLGMMSSNVFSVGMDMVLIMMLLGLWAMWWKQGKRTERIETGLLEAAAQLQEAATLLDDALHQISLLQQHEDKKQTKVSQTYRASTVSMEMQRDDLEEDIEPQFSSRARELLNAQKENMQKENIDRASSPATSRASRSKEKEPQGKQGAMDMTHILRLQREGASMDSIADNLNMPLAQVKLMLMLQKGV